MVAAMRNAISHKRSVILGAGGFIGINLANALAARGREVICFDRFASPHWPQKATSITGEFSAMPPELLAALDDATIYRLVSSCRPSQHTEIAANEVIADVVTTFVIWNPRATERSAGFSFPLAALSMDRTSLAPQPKRR